MFLGMVKKVHAYVVVEFPLKQMPSLKQKTFHLFELIAMFCLQCRSTVKIGRIVSLII